MDNLCGEFRPRTAARCPAADVYPDSSRRKYGREYEPCLDTVSSGSTRVVPAFRGRARSKDYPITL